MTTIPDSILIACLDALENGESADEILARYPEYIEALRPFLDTAVMLHELPPPPTCITAAFGPITATFRTFVRSIGRISF